MTESPKKNLSRKGKQNDSDKESSRTGSISGSDFQKTAQNTTDPDLADQEATFQQKGENDALSDTGFFDSRTQAIDPSQLEATQGSIEWGKQSAQNQEEARKPQESSEEKAAPSTDDEQTRVRDLESETIFREADQAAKKGEGSLDSDGIDGFDILEELGRGAFGVVYRALDIKLDREVAIKVPLLQDTKLAKQYIREARNAAKIDAHGIIPVFQVGSTKDGQPFVVQKLIDGSTLGSILEKADVPVSWAISTLAKVANAISKAHESGLVHRDLKPDNILIDQKGEPWIADFGLAVFEEDQKGLRGEIAGTPVYMAPEQLSNRADWLDGRADIWALGIILYKTLSGRLPFESEEFFELKQQILNRHPKPLSQRSSALPSDLDEVFNRCCAKDVTGRYGRASELAVALMEVLEHSGIPLEEIQIESSSDGSATIRSRSISKIHSTRRSTKQSIQIAPQEQATNRWLGIGLASIAIVGVIGFLVIWSKLNEQDPPVPSVDSAGGSTVGIPKNRSPVEPETTEVRTPADLGTAQEAEQPAQIIVSLSGDGTHESLAEAIEAAKPDAEIQVSAGTYRESLLIEKNVQLVGLGSRDEVRIVGQENAAFTIKGDAQVGFANLFIDAKGTDINTVELISGELEIKGCELETSSYDCIKVHPASSLQISSCRLSSMENPAIVSKQAKKLTIDNCDFQFDLASVAVERKQQAVAIELTESPATIQNCTFTGTGKKGKGISARGSSGRILIDENRFTGLMHAVELFECRDVNLVGLNLISDCQLGIVAESSSGVLEELEILESQIGCSLDGKNSFLFSNATVRNCKYGIRILDSDVEFEGSKIENNTLVAMMVDVPGKIIKLEDCSLRENKIAVLMPAGTLEFTQGTISSNSAVGILVADYSVDPKSFAERANSPDLVRRVVAKSTRINGKKGADAMFFRAPGSYKFEKAIYNDFQNGNKPRLGEGLTSEQKGQEVSVIPLKGGE
ncbi:MAG: protein kinase [Planctomycetota bacterium]